MIHPSDMLRLNPYLLEVAPITPTERKYLRARLSGNATGEIAKAHGVSERTAYTSYTKAMRKLSAFARLRPQWLPVYGSYRARADEMTSAARYPYHEPQPMKWLVAGSVTKE